MIKILYNEKKIYLTENYAACMQALQLKSAFLLFNYGKAHLLKSLDILMISEIDQIIITGNVDDILTVFRQQFLYIQAAGGLVLNSQNEYLLIFRRSKWDLPKGKLEPDETLEHCAIREVVEETGVRDVHILSTHAVTYHFYFEGEMVFKETQWYLMQSGRSVLKPQVIEGITKAVWIPRSNIDRVLKNTYESIRDLFALLKQQATPE